MYEMPLPGYEKSLRKMSHTHLLDEIERLVAEYGIAEFELSAAVNIPKGADAIINAQRRERVALTKIKLALTLVRQYSPDAV